MPTKAVYTTEEILTELNRKFSSNGQGVYIEWGCDRNKECWISWDHQYNKWVFATRLVKVPCESLKDALERLVEFPSPGGEELVP